MKQLLKSKMLWIGFILLVIGTIFGYLENTFYQYIDENGVLIESWFMPLSFLCMFIGGTGLFIFAIKTIWLILKSAKKKKGSGLHFAP